MPVTTRTPRILRRRTSITRLWPSREYLRGAFDTYPPAAPTTAAFDDFNTGAAQRVTARAGWSTVPLFNFNTGLLTDATPTYASAPESLNDAAWGTALPLGQEIWATFSAYGSAPAGGNDFYLRVNALNTAGGAALTCYQLKRAASSNVWQILADLGAVSTNLTPGVTQIVSAGDSIGFNCVGSTISSWYRASGGNWSLMETATDNQITAGSFVATDSYDATIRYDMIGGGAISHASPAPRIVRRTWSGR